MAKLSLYIMMMSGITLLFYFSGLMGDTSAICSEADVGNALLCLLLAPEDMPSASDVLSTNKIKTAIGGLVGLGVVIGAFFTGQIELAIISPVAILTFNLLWNFLEVFNKVRDINPIIAFLFFAPFLYLFTLAILDWWRGRDT